MTDQTLDVIGAAMELATAQQIVWRHHRGCPPECPKLDGGPCGLPWAQALLARTED